MPHTILKRRAQIHIEKDEHARFGELAQSLTEEPLIETASAEFAKLPYVVRDLIEAARKVTRPIGEAASRCAWPC